MKFQGGSPEALSGEPPQTTSDGPARFVTRGTLLWGLLGLSLLLIGAGALIVSGSFDTRPTVRLVGHDAPINQSARTPGDISALNSPTVVANPVRSSELVAASRIDTPFFSCAVQYSTDAGASWKHTPVPAPRGEEAKCFAPDVAFSRDGTLYLSFVTLAGAGNAPNALWLSKSTDGGRTLSAPQRIHGPLSFQVRLAPDPERASRVYMTWLQGRDVGTLKFLAPGNPITAVRSDDAGATWSEPVPVNSSARGRVVTPAPVVGADGTLYVLYVDLGDDALDYEAGHKGRGGPAYDGRYSLVLSRSTDAGASWKESVVDQRLSPIDRFVVFLAPAPSIAVDADGRVYAAFHDDRLGDPDVWLWTLEPGKSSWRGPVRVNDTRRQDASAQYLPKIAVAPDGRLDVLYYDRRQDPGNIRNHTSLQSSFDHGETFTRAIGLSSRPSDARIGFGAKEGLPDLGSRLGLISTDTAALAVWTDTRAGTAATQKQDLAAAAVAVTNPARLSDGARSALRYGGLLIAIAGLALLGLALAKRSGPDDPIQAPPERTIAKTPVGV